MWFLSLSLEDHLNTILIQYRSCNGGERGAWEDFMKNTESGPPRSSGPLMHLNNAPKSVPSLENVVSLWSAYSHRKPQNQLSPHPQVPFPSSSSRTLGVQTAGGCQGDLSRGLQASVRDCCSWTKRVQQRAAQVVRELPDQSGTYLPLLRLRVTTLLSQCSE